MVDLAERCASRGDGLDRFSYVSTAYVAGAHRGTFGEDNLDVGQSFRNSYERSKFEAERLLRERASGLPPQVLRPSIVVGDSRTGWTSSFNVLYPPLRAFAHGAIPALPARRRSPVDVVPVDYVADSVHELSREGPDGTFHLVAGRNATTVGRLMELAARRFDRPAPPVFPPRLYRRVVHPLLMRRLGRARARGAAAHGGLLPVLLDAGPLRRPPPSAGAAGGGLLRPPARLRRARPLGAPPGRATAGGGGRTLVCVIERLVEQIESRFGELSQQMADPEVIGDQRRYAEVGRAYRALEPAHQLAQEWRRATDDAAGARELIAEDGDDPELRELLRSSEERLGQLEEEIRLAMVEPDPNDDKDVIVEIRPGTGGEEAGLFAADLYRMLSRYAERRGFKQEPLEVGDGHYTFAVKGQGAYSVFKYEGGTHRVQRVPETESQGRIHTSTATIAVLPEAEEVDVQIDPNDLQIDVYRSSGPGGQSVNTTDSAVRITHKPTGLVVSMQDEKSQLQNRDRAMRVLRARLLERELAAQQAEEAAQRLAQVGSGARAEKIRTYNFPQDRVTDHRVGLTKGNLPGVLGGELDEFTAALEAEDKRRKLEVSAV